jgi:hypothetical protein
LDEQQVGELVAQWPATAAGEVEEVEEALAVLQPGAAGTVPESGQLGVQAGGLGEDEEQPAGTLVDLAGSGGECGGPLMQVRAGGVGVPERFPVDQGDAGLGSLLGADGGVIAPLDLSHELSIYLVKSLAIQSSERQAE